MNLYLQRRISRYLSAVVTVLVFLCMIHPNPVVPFEMNDRIAHCLAFYGLTILFLSIRSKRQLIVIGIAVGISCATEVSQLLVVSRHADPIDLVANFVGIGAAFATWTGLSRLIQSSAPDDARGSQPQIYP